MEKLEKEILYDAGLLKKKNIQLEALYTDRSSWEPTWRQLQQFINPYRGRLDEEESNDGARRDALKKVMIDPYPMEAHRICAAGIQGGLTSPGRPWFSISLQDEEKGKSHYMRRWLDDCHELMMNIYAKSNVYSMFYHHYAEISQFGTGSSIIHEDYNTGLWCKSLTIGEYAGGIDYRGKVCMLGRKYKLSAMQLVREFGLENVSQGAKKAYERGDISRSFEVRILIDENTQYDKDTLAYGNFPWRSYYWEVGNRDKFLRVKGFYECPFLMPRWSTISNNVYGYGPGHNALGNCMQIQKMDKAKLKILDLESDPALVIPSSLKDVERLPGGVNRVPDMTNFKISTLYPPNNGYEKIDNMSERKHQAINSAFFNDLFIMLANSDRTDITAREVSERHEEKLLMLGPVLDQMNNEILSPTTKRTFGICLRNGIFPPCPEEINEDELKVEFISVLAQAQKMVEVPAIERLVAFAGNLTGVKPDILDNIKLDDILREHANLDGVKEKLLNSIEEVVKLREAREEAQRKQQQNEELAALAQNIKPAAEGARLLADTPVRDTNALDAILGGGR